MNLRAHGTTLNALDPGHRREKREERAKNESWEERKQSRGKKKHELGKTKKQRESEREKERKREREKERKREREKGRKKEEKERMKEREKERKRERKKERKKEKRLRETSFEVHVPCATGTAAGSRHFKKRLAGPVTWKNNTCPRNKRQ